MNKKTRVLLQRKKKSNDLSPNMSVLNPKHFFLETFIINNNIIYCPIIYFFNTFLTIFFLV